MITRYLEWGLAYCKDSAVTGFFSPPSPIFIITVTFQCFQTIICFLDYYTSSMVVVLG